ncbi:MAG: hypothetical protein E3J64_08240 [Anaerolineales bacterium]|nr:MAG: hypothetical protein E3J64_08240 [Anaerolineales bacterium]
MSKYKILLVLLLVASLGCGLLGGDTDDAGDTGNGNGGGAADDNGAGDAPSIEDLTGLDSYRIRYSWVWTPDDGEPEAMTSFEEYTRAPEAHRLGFESEGEMYEFVQIEGQAWTCFAGMCAFTQDPDPDELEGFATDLDDLGLDESDLDYVGRETINGIRTRHYEVDLNLASLLLFAQGDIDDAEAEVWIADESGMPSFVVKYESSWREDREEDAGTFEIAYEVYDINASFTIEPPEGATGWPEDIPAYPNATDVLLMESLVSFSTSDDLATVIDYYEAGLVDAGWTMQDETDMGAAVMQSWSKGGQTLSLTASEDEGTTGVVFAIG